MLVKNFFYDTKLFNFQMDALILLQMHVNPTLHLIRVNILDVTYTCLLKVVDKHKVKILINFCSSLKTFIGLGIRIILLHAVQ